MASMLRFLLLAAMVLLAGCGASGLGTKKARKSSNSSSTTTETLEVPREQMEQAQGRLLARLERVDGLLAGLDGTVGALPEEERDEVQPRLSLLVTKQESLAAAARALPQTNGPIWRKTHANLVDDLRHLETSALQLQTSLRGQ